MQCFAGQRFQWYEEFRQLVDTYTKGRTWLITEVPKVSELHTRLDSEIDWLEGAQKGEKPISLLNYVKVIIAENKQFNHLVFYYADAKRSTI